MQRFWKAALAVGGVAAIGSFFFWSLNQQWLKLPIFAHLTSDQTFALMRIFLFLTFGAFSICAFLFVSPKIFVKRTEEAPPPPTPPAASVAEAKPVPPPPIADQSSSSLDTVLSAFPRDILKAYRSTISNSATTMAYLDHLAGRSDASESELIGLVSNAVTNNRTPTGAHIRDVLFVLTDADFLTVERRRVVLTKLGRIAYDNICNRESNPLATARELEGYRLILRSHDVRMPLLKALHPSARLTEEQIVKLVKSSLEAQNKTIPIERATNALLLALGTTKLVRLEGDYYSLTDLGKRVCQDLSLSA